MSDDAETMVGKRSQPVNGWRIVASISLPLFLYTTWMYAETSAKFRHHLEHCGGGSLGLSTAPEPHDHAEHEHEHAVSAEGAETMTSSPESVPGAGH